MTTEYDNDFGFSFSDEVDPTLSAEEQDSLNNQVTALTAEVNRLKKVNREMLKMITKVMNNLKENPDKPNIHWPNRVEKIDKFLNELNDLDKKNDSEEKPTT